MKQKPGPAAQDALDKSRATALLRMLAAGPVTGSIVRKALGVSLRGQMPGWARPEWLHNDTSKEGLVVLSLTDAGRGALAMLGDEVPACEIACVTGGAAGNA